MQRVMLLTLQTNLICYTTALKHNGGAFSLKQS